VNGTVHLLEKTAFYDGFYQAFDSAGIPASGVSTSTASLMSRKGSWMRACEENAAMDLVRPSMEAAGIDVFATALNIGWELDTIPCKNVEYGKIVQSHIHSVGLVLTE